MLCRIIYPTITDYLSNIERISFLINYIKAQIDLSVVDKGEDSAVNLFEKLYALECDDQDLTLQIRLLGMSAYEHILAHDRILELYHEAEALVSSENNSFSDVTLSIFYRNKGLCFPHSELKTDYFNSLRHAANIEDFLIRHLMFGTSMNNIGLCFFYNGDAKRALRAFISAKKHLDRVGYNTTRIISNMGVCHYMLHEWESAYQCFSDATAAHMDGIFMNLCIQTNLALSLYSIGKKSDAKDLLDELIMEYKNGHMRSKDTLIYCAAMINRGYFAFMEKDYFKAAELYHSSCMHSYRYQNAEQLQKRQNMRDIALWHAKVTTTEAQMDIADEGTDFYQKPYSLIPFAFYVI